MDRYHDEEIKEGLKQERLKRNESAAIENVKKFYTENEDYIALCYKYYLQYELEKSNYIKSVQYDEKKFVKEIQGKTILVLTANSIEEGVLLHGLADACKEKVSFYYLYDYAYHVCHINEYTIIHMHAVKTGEEATRRSINAARKMFKPKVIILLGICYGLDYDNHELGTVLISSILKTYRLNFRDSDIGEETIFEAEEEEHKKPNSHLFSHVERIFSYRHIYSSISVKPNLRKKVKWDTGIILSSNSLMSSKKVKTAILEAFGSAKPKPVGGEMEGGGLLKTKIVEEDNLDCWLVVKGISDWGEKKNSFSADPKISQYMKAGIQAMAMVHAWSMFYEMVMQRCL